MKERKKKRLKKGAHYKDKVDLNVKNIQHGPNLMCILFVHNLFTASRGLTLRYKLKEEKVSSTHNFVLTSIIGSWLFFCIHFIQNFIVVLKISMLLFFGQQHCKVSFCVLSINSGLAAVSLLYSFPASFICVPRELKRALFYFWTLTI